MFHGKSKNNEVCKNTATKNLQNLEAAGREFLALTHSTSFLETSLNCLLVYCRSDLRAIRKLIYTLFYCRSDSPLSTPYQSISEDDNTTETVPLISSAPQPCAVSSLAPSFFFIQTLRLQSWPIQIHFSFILKSITKNRTFLNKK